MARHLFSINSGRCGSAYLAHLLGSAEGVRAFHEPEPRMARRRGPLARWRKVRAVRRESAGAAVYAETSHMFILSFADLVMRRLRDVEVILLRRYLPHVVQSLVALDAPRWRDWYAEPGPEVRPPGGLDAFDRAIGHVLEVEVRAARFRRRHPATRVHEVRIEELNTPAGVARLLEVLGLTARRDAGFVVGRRSNLKEKALAVDEGECRARIEGYLARCRDAGLALPPLPQMEPC